MDFNVGHTDINLGLGGTDNLNFVCAQTKKPISMSCNQHFDVRLTWGILSYQLPQSYQEDLVVTKVLIKVRSQGRHTEWHKWLWQTPFRFGLILVPPLTWGRPLRVDSNYSFGHEKLEGARSHGSLINSQSYQCICNIDHRSHAHTQLLSAKSIWNRTKYRSHERIVRLLSGVIRPWIFLWGECQNCPGAYDLFVRLVAVQGLRR